MKDQDTIVLHADLDIARLLYLVCMAQNLSLVWLQASAMSFH